MQMCCFLRNVDYNQGVLEFNVLPWLHGEDGSTVCYDWPWNNLFKYIFQFHVLAMKHNTTHTQKTSKLKLHMELFVPSMTYFRVEKNVSVLSSDEVLITGKGSSEYMAPKFTKE